MKTNDRMEMQRPREKIEREREKWRKEEEAVVVVGRTQTQIGRCGPTEYIYIMKEGDSISRNYDSQVNSSTWSKSFPPGISV